MEMIKFLLQRSQNSKITYVQPTLLCNAHSLLSWSEEKRSNLGIKVSEIDAVSSIAHLLPTRCKLTFLLACSLVAELRGRVARMEP